MKKLLIALGLAITTGFASIPASAVPLTFTPSQVVGIAVGDIFNVDVIVSGLDAEGQVASAYDIDILFNDTQLDLTSVSLGLALGDFDLFEAISAVDTSTAGIARLTVTSFLTDDDLAALQGDSVTIATLTFTAAADAEDFIRFGTDPVFQRNVVGRRGETLAVNVNQVCVGVGEGNDCRSEPVPVPAPFLLLGAGVLGLLASRRFARAQ